MPTISLDHHRDPLEQLVEQASILLAETTFAFDDRHRTAPRFAVDLAAQPAPEAQYPDLGLTYRAHFLGTFSSLDNSLLWGWENVNGFPPAAIEIAHNLRIFAEHANIPELSTANVPVAEETTAARIVSAAVRITGNGTLRRVPTQHGVAYFLLQGFDLGPSRVVAVQRAIGDALASGALRNHVEALEAYVDMRADVTARGSAKGLVLACSDGELEIELDEQGRISLMRFTIDERSKGALRGDDGQ